MEVLDNEVPIKLIKIREDLQEYFEVISHEEKTLRCKLVGRNDCKLNLLAFDERRGWYNFERHVRKVHKLLGPKVPIRQKPAKSKKRQFAKKNKSTPSTSIVQSSSGENLEHKWKNLHSKEKHCLMCLGVCLATSDKDRIADEAHLRRLFPGCEGSTRLSQQLFFIFFLRKLVDFPAKKCQELLKKCRGRRMPDTWFSLCVTCRELIVKAAAINEQLARLQYKMLKIKARVRSTFKECVERNSSTINLSGIETEIRNHILETEGVTVNIPINNGYECRTENPDDSAMDERIDQLIKIESKYDDEPSLVDYGTFSPRRRKCTRTNYKEVECTEDQDEELNCSHLITKVERGPFNNCKYSDIEKISNDIHFSDPDECIDIAMLDINENEDSDFEAAASDVSKDSTADDDSEVSDDNYLPMKRSIKSKKANLKKKVKQTDFVQKQSGNSKTSDGDHIPKGNQREVHVCQFCPSKYQTIGSLKEHLEAHEISKTQNNQYDCETCGYPCLSEKSKKLHSRIKHCSIEELKCTLCDHVSSTKRQFTLHFQVHREEAERERVEGKYVCKLCNRLFISFQTLTKHKRTSHYQEIGVDPFRCEYCSLICSTKRLLRDHVLQVHKKESKYFCDICGKGMQYMNKLRRHMSSHFKEKRFVCHLCGADFLYTETLKGHMKRDHPETFEGTTGANPEIPQIPENKYTCKQCGIVLASATLLGRHVKTHVELFANNCNLCGKNYATPQSLRRHKEINHSEGQVPCKFCGKMFPHKDNIRSHYKFCGKYPNREKKVAGAIGCGILNADADSDGDLMLDAEPSNS